MQQQQQGTETVQFDDQIVRCFLLAMLIFAGVAFLAGLVAALQMAFWQFNFNSEYITFGRLRPLHTNAAIFAFAGNAIFAGIYYSTPRLLKTPMFSPLLSRIHFWGWQFIILLAAITLPLGYSHGKEYAELEWPIDLLITLIWVVFAVNFFGTVAKRRERHMYVAVWFYIATIITVAVLHVVNSIEIPVTLLKSYPVYAGIQDALVQWWYGHNAVAFFLTTPFLGLMYYFVPKAVGRPVYSYRLSIVHFWSLVFLYIWAGPHHLLYSAMPEWAQTLGMIFSVMLWAPSWGGMINGLLTLRGAWHLLRTEPIVQFFVAAITFYGMSTFEGPMMSIKSVNGLAHFTDWVIGHVHSGALGWNGMLAFGMTYFLIPKLWGKEMYSRKLMTYHFWIALLGILIYYLSMTMAGLTQGLMWRAVDETGRLVYPDFVETVARILPLYYLRIVGGTLFLVGFIIMAINVWKTIASAPAQKPVSTFRVPALGALTGKGHRKLEGMALAFSILAFLSILVGSVIEILPTLSIHKYVEPEFQTRVYSALELEGRDLYIREGCYVCHSQMIRPMGPEVLRYGQPSKIADSLYDHPFQWGSKRTGPDLARVGGKYPDQWHLRHMLDPRQINQDSLMPAYPWLAEKKIDFLRLRKKLSVQKMVGVPYSDEQAANADRDAEAQALALAQGLGDETLKDKEIVAIIAYLQSLGKLAVGPEKTAEVGK